MSEEDNLRKFQMLEEDKLKELGIHTPEESIAKAISELSSVKKIKMFSVLKRESDVFRFAVIFNVGEELGLDWLTKYGNDSLMLLCALKRKGKRARDDIVEVVKQPKQQGGTLSDKIKSFIRSE